MKEYQDIIKAICLLCPEELEKLRYISDGGSAKKLELDLLKEDVDFVLQLLDNLPSDVHSNLDYLAYFSSSVMSNVSVLEKTLKLLKEELSKNPKYRFEYLSYEENNTLLDDIFGGKIGDNELYYL